MKKLVLVSLVMILLPSVLSAKEPTERFEKVVNRMVKAINDANWTGVRADFGKEMLDFLPLEKSTPFFKGMVAQYGKIEKLDTCRYTPPDTAIFLAHFERGILDITITLDEHDKIIGLLFAPPKPQMPISAISAKEPTERFDKVVNRMVKAINEANWTGARVDFSQMMINAFPQDKSTPFFQGLIAQYGKIKKLDACKFTPPSIAVFPAHFEHGILDIKIVLDEQDKLIGLWFLPHTSEVPAIEKHQTQLSLPVKGKWLVFWGGDTKELNQHHDTPNQRFAFDFVGADETGKTHKGEGKTNEDYFAFGREIIAPADGNVTDVINGVRDNVPGSMNPYSAVGNAVFIKHRDNEVSVLAHLKLDSVKVKVGDKVTKGQVIGLCGNSGNSSEPHLHYHLQNTLIIQDGTGIKCIFDKVTVIKAGQSQVNTNYSPVKGDIISAD